MARTYLKTSKLGLYAIQVLSLSSVPYSKGQSRLFKQRQGCAIERETGLSIQEEGHG